MPSTVEQIVRWGTAGGAQVLGFDGIGTLAVGQAADIAVYALDAPRYFGLHDPALGPVVSGGRPTLNWLVACGRVVVADDAIPGLDMAELAGPLARRGNAADARCLNLSERLPAQPRKMNAAAASMQPAAAM